MFTYTFSGTENPIATFGSFVAMAGSGNAQTLSGEWFSATATQSTWLYNVQLTAAEISAEVTLGTINTDSRGPCFATLLGDGYCLLARSTDLRLFIYNDGALGSLLATVTMAISAADLIKMTLVPATGLFTFFVDGVSVGTHTDTTYMTDLYGGLFSRSGRVTSVTIDGEAASAAIVNINGDDTVVQGAANNTLVTTLLTVSTLTVGGIAVTLTEVDADNHTWPMPGFVDSAAYPLPGTVSASVNAGEATLDVTLSLDPAYTARTMGTLSTAPDSIYALALAQGLTIVTDNVLYNSAGLTTYTDSTISDADDGTHIIWHRDHTTNIMTRINLLVAGGVIVNRGITVRALTMRSATLRALTSSNL